MSGETAKNGGEKLSGVTGVTEPRDTDVLCGRGGAALRHPGNQTYRRLVNLNKGLYITCLKTEKLKISRSIVAAIREQQGRFLEKDNSKGTWFDIGDKKAIEKTSQALREGQPKLRQKIVEMGGGAAGTAALMEQQFGANGIYAQSAAGIHQQHALQQQGGIRGFHHDNPLAQQMGPGGHLGGGQMAQAMMNPQYQSMAAMRQQHQQQQHMNQQQQYRQQQMQQNFNNSNMGHHQQQRMQQHHDMPPPQARQALHNEMMRLSMHGEDDPNNPNQQGRQQHSQQQQHPGDGQRGSGNNHNNSSGGSLRPSMVKQQRGSDVSSNFGLQVGSSNMSLMSEFSGFGSSAHGGSLGGMRSNHQGGNNDPYGGMFNDNGMDRRNLFAKMKFSRPPSDRMSAGGMSGRNMGGSSMHSMGDGMPDFHMVESQLSLFSNLSGITGTESRQTKASYGDETTGSGGRKSAGGGAAAAAAASSGTGTGDLLGASRHSIMSGLSRISDASEVHSIFSDLSKKIGNVSTRSIAMSEISGIDAYRGGDDSDSTPSFGEADNKLNPGGGGNMDFDVF